MMSNLEEIKNEVSQQINNLKNNDNQNNYPIDTYSAPINCKDDCTGKCQGLCTDVCTGCKNSCKGSCENKCGDGCKGNCGNTCNKGCALICSTNCTGNCSGGCKGTCSGTCKGGCNKDCSDACTANCSLTCNTACKGNCCNGCSTGCKGKCQTRCQTYCKNQQIYSENIGSKFSWRKTPIKDNIIEIWAEDWNTLASYVEAAAPYCIENGGTVSITSVNPNNEIYASDFNSLDEGIGKINKRVGEKTAKIDYLYASDFQSLANNYNTATIKCKQTCNQKWDKNEPSPDPECKNQDVSACTQTDGL